MNMPLGIGLGPRIMAVAHKNLGYFGVLSDLLGRVNGRQEGKLTGGAGNRDGKAKRMGSLRVFLATHDQHVFLSCGNLAL